MGAHMGTVSGQATTRAASTSSMLMSLRYWDSGFWVEWRWFFALTAASCRQVVP